jgi:hypothetical protein
LPAAERPAELLHGRPPSVAAELFHCLIAGHQLDLHGVGERRDGERVGERRDGEVETIRTGSVRWVEILKMGAGADKERERAGYNFSTTVFQFL